jgi:hypothetical protein
VAIRNHYDDTHVLFEKNTIANNKHIFMHYKRVIVAF